MKRLVVHDEMSQEAAHWAATKVHAILTCTIVKLFNNGPGEITTLHCKPLTSASIKLIIRANLYLIAS